MSKLKSVEISPMDKFRALGLLSESGKPRLNVAQGYFKNLDDLTLLEELYVFWRDFAEYLVLRSLHVHPKKLTNEWGYVAVKCSKRGNDVYVWRVKKRLGWLFKISEKDVKFFSVSDFKPNKKIFTQAIWITLTYDVKRCSKEEAWENIGVEWNRFISALRRKYGKISVVRTWEATNRGYPHIHAILLFHEAKFEVFPNLEEFEGKLVLRFRVKKKSEIASYWHSFVDVQGLNSVKRLVGYMWKYQTKTLLNSNSPKGVLSMALMWLFRKRSFSVSGDFRKMLSDLICSLRNSNGVLVQALLFGGVCEASVWEFVGVFSGVELGINPRFWSVRLKPEQIEIVLLKNR
jgi:hypothetical protein